MEKAKGKIAVFEKALNAFSELIKIKPTAVERDAAIQRFEYSFELAWKSLKEILKTEGFTNEELSSPRKVLKNGFIAGFVKNEAIWIEMLQERNLTSHTYNEQLANDIYNEFDSYYKHLVQLLNLLKQYKN